MDAVLPGVAEGSDLLGLSSDVVELAVLDVALLRATPASSSRTDPVRRVEIDRLDLALETLLLGEARHHQQRVAEDQAVRPVLLVLVEVDELLELDAVEVVEEAQLRSGSPAAAVWRRFSMIARGLDLLLDVDRDGRHFEVLRGPARPCPSRRAAGRGTGRADRASASGASPRRRRSRAARWSGCSPACRVADRLDGRRPGRLLSSPCGGVMPARPPCASGAMRSRIADCTSHGSSISMNPSGRTRRGCSRPGPRAFARPSHFACLVASAPAGDLDDEVEQVVLAVAVVDARR